MMMLTLHATLIHHDNEKAIDTKPVLSLVATSSDDDASPAWNVCTNIPTGDAVTEAAIDEALMIISTLIDREIVIRRHAQAHAAAADSAHTN